MSGALGFVEPSPTEKAWLCRTCFVVHPTGVYPPLFILPGLYLGLPPLFVRVDHAPSHYRIPVS